ncbi:hypothetical protein [Arthrobacter sp. D3-16]
MALIAEMILATRMESLGQPGRPEQSLASHRKIAYAMKCQDAERAPRPCWPTSSWFWTWSCPAERPVTDSLRAKLSPDRCFSLRSGALTMHRSCTRQ